MRPASKSDVAQANHGNPNLQFEFHTKRNARKETCCTELRNGWFQWLIPHTHGHHME